MAIIAFSFVETCLAAAAFLLGLWWFLNRKKKDPRVPPGPSPLPLIGNLHQVAIGGKPQQAMKEMAERYGPCFSIRFGTEDAIILNDHKLIKDVFAETSASGRTNNPIWITFANGKYGVIFAEGAHWEQQRRFTLRTLRDFGFAKTAMEGMILEEVNSMLKYFENRLDKPINGDRIFNGPVVNSLWNIMSGERSDWDSTEKPRIFQEAENLISAINHINKAGLPAVPFMRYIAPDRMGWTGFLNAVQGLTRMCNEAKERRRMQLNPSSPQNFIDHYLLEMDTEKDPSSSFYGENGTKNLSALLPDLFLAGSETTSHTLSWTLLLLAHNQNVQKKLQNELDAVVGPGRQPSISDKPNLPYTEATIMEILRRTSVANFGVPHRMVEDAMIGGHFFPNNTTILSNIWYAHNNPKVWGDPEQIRPERFLTPDGKKVLKHEAFLPFSLGRRQCLGKSLAEDTLFLFTSCIFQKFTVTPDPSSEGFDLKMVEPVDKLLNEPDPFKIVISLRK